MPARRARPRGARRRRRARACASWSPATPSGPCRSTGSGSPPYCLSSAGTRPRGAHGPCGGGRRGARGDGYGLRVAAELGEGLAARGWTVVSGAAFGIDAAAHRGALAAGAPPWRSSPAGSTCAYPRAHDALFGRVAGSGAVVSEVPRVARTGVGSSPATGSSRLLARGHRGRRGGAALGVARHRRARPRHHLPVGAVPGPVTSATSAGCHELIRERGPSSSPTPPTSSSSPGRSATTPHRTRARGPPDGVLRPRRVRRLGGRAGPPRLTAGAAGRRSPGSNPSGCRGARGPRDARLVERPQGRWRKSADGRNARLMQPRARPARTRRPGSPAGPNGAFAAVLVALPTAVRPCRRECREPRGGLRVRAPPALRTRSVREHRARVRARRHRLPRRRRRSTTTPPSAR